MKHINLDNLDRLCKGDERKRSKYLTQYLEIIPSAVIRVELALMQIDRSALAKELHFIYPQLLFFGFEKFSFTHIQDKSDEDLLCWTNSILDRIKNSILEIENILQKK